MDQYVEELRQFSGQCDIYEEARLIIGVFMPVYPEEAVVHQQELDQIHRDAVTGSGMKHEPTCPLAGAGDFSIDV